MEVEVRIVRGEKGLERDVNQALKEFLWLKGGFSGFKGVKKQLKSIKA